MGFTVVNTATVDPVAMAYHELRSPLGLVITAARSAAEECPADYDVLRTRCQSIVRAAERMLVTAQQILSLPAHPAPEQDSCFDPLAALPSAVSELSELGVSLSLQRSPLPALVFGSRAKFETLIVSLLNNALDHSEPGTEIEVVAGTTHRDAVVEIRNMVALADRHEGYGIGSRVANELARCLGAELHTTLDHGSFTVTVRLPLAQRVAVAS